MQLCDRYTVSLASYSRGALAHKQYTRPNRIAYSLLEEGPFCLFKCSVSQLGFHQTNIAARFPVPTGGTSLHV